MPTSGALLEVEGLTVRYGQVHAVDEVSLRVDRGEVLALLGANGAGKSSLLRALSGLVRPASGRVRLDGARLEGRRPHVIARAGLAHVPEGRRVVAPLDVEQNLLMAAHAARRRRGTEVADGLDEVYGTFPVLRERRRQASGLLSGGEQQMLAIGRGIMAKPAVLLLDEPSMGLAPIMVQEIFRLLGSRSGTLAEAGIVLAEQSANVALEVADRAVLLSRGAAVYDGPARDLDEAATVTAYLGQTTRAEPRPA